MAWTNFAITIGEFDYRMEQSHECDKARTIRSVLFRRRRRQRFTLDLSLTFPRFTPSLLPANQPTNRAEKKNSVGVGSIYYLMRRDVRQGAAQLRRNAKTIKGWIEEAEAGAKNGASAAGEGGGGSKPPLPPPPKQDPPSSSAPSKAE